MRGRPTRLGTGPLQGALEPTQRRRCSRGHPRPKRRFPLLGCACFGRADRHGVPRVRRRPARQKRHAAGQRRTAWSKPPRHRPGRGGGQWLQARLRGPDHDDGVRGHARSLPRFVHGAMDGTCTGRNRRGGKRRRAPGEPWTRVLDRVKRARPRLTEVPRRRVVACRRCFAPRKRVPPKNRRREHCTSGSVGVATRSRTSSCYAGDIRDITWCAATSTLPRQAAGATGRSEALGTREPHQHGGVGSVRKLARLPASRRAGAGSDDRANTREPLINVVRTHKPKRLSGLHQKVRGQVEGLPHHLPQLSSHRRTGGASLIHGTRAERGKPVSLPGESEP